MPSGTDISGSITTGGTAQTIALENKQRKALTVQNISAGDLWINETGGAAVINGAGSFKLGTGLIACVSTDDPVSIIGATTGQKFTATEV